MTYCQKLIISIFKDRQKGITLAKIITEFLSRHDILSRMDYFYIYRLTKGHNFGKMQ